MDKIPFIVDRLNQPPFNKGFSTLTELDGKSSLELFDILCEIIIDIDPEQEMLSREPPEYRVMRILNFLTIMKFHIPDGQMDHFRDLMMAGDKDVLHDVMFWALQRFEHLQKKAYLGKYLIPVDVPAECMNDDRVQENVEYLKELQLQFRETHKNYDQMQQTGVRPAELRAEISQLESQITQLNNKISKLKKDTHGDQASFSNMLKVTSRLRKEQEDEANKQDKLREQRGQLQDIEGRLRESSRRLQEARGSGAQSRSAEQLLSSLQKDVRELNEIKERVDNTYSDRRAHLERLQSMEHSENITVDDVRSKQRELQEILNEQTDLRDQLDAIIERNTKLATFHQACSVSLSKLREKEKDFEKLSEDKRRILRQIDDKEAELRSQGKGASSKSDPLEKKKYKAQVNQKVEKYKKMREELSAHRAEQVILQRTEQILKSRHKNIDAFVADLERKKGVEGFRETQRALVDMTEKTAEVDQRKGETLEEISRTVETIGREFKEKQTQLQPLMTTLKALRQEYTEVEAEYMQRRGQYDKVAVGLEVEKNSLEKECDSLQEDCLREESRYHFLNCMVGIMKQKVDRADQERRWRQGDGRMLRDFSCLKDLYAHKNVQQEQLTKQLRNQTKTLKENASVMTNQKTLFKDLAVLLDAKVRSNVAEGTMGPMIGSRLGSAGTGGYSEGLTFGNSDVMVM